MSHLQQTFILIVILLVCSRAEAQYNYNNNWILQSQKANGITFNQYTDGYPDTLLIPGDAQRVRTIISDKYGNLAFYLGRDGRIYNNEHLMIRNGDQPYIHQFGSHTFLAFPKPAEKNQYFLFHTQPDPPMSFYSEIDMDFYRGRVKSANNILDKGVYGWSTTLARHEKEDHYWLISKKAGTDSILAYLVAPGKFPAGRTASVLPAISDIDAKGPYIAITPDSRLIATRLWDSRNNPDVTYLVIGFFNPASGQVEDIMTIDTLRDGTLIRSLALSPQGSKLYVNTSRGRKKTIEQYDLTEPTARGIQRSRFTLITHNRLHWGDFAMMPGPDGKIYFSRAHFTLSDSEINSPTMGVIHYPDRMMLNCDISPHPYAKWGRPPHISPVLTNPGFIIVDRPFTHIPTPVRIRNYSKEHDSVRWRFFHEDSLFIEQTTLPDHGIFRIPFEGPILTEAVRYRDGNIDTLRQVITFVSSTSPEGTGKNHPLPKNKTPDLLLGILPE